MALPIPTITRITLAMRIPLFAGSQRVPRP